MRRIRSRTFLFRAAAVVVAATVLAGCADKPSVASSPVNDAAVQIVAFNASEPGWNATVHAFYATSEGAGIALAPNFASSGDQVSAVLAGKPADVVHLSTESDMTALVRANLISPDWNSGPTGGVPFGSIATIVVRKGNPRGIATWADLLQPGLEVLTPSPVKVGSGRWALLAAYAATSAGNQNPEAGKDYLRRLILEHVMLGPTTVKAAVDEFEHGRGDVLLASESIALDMQRQGLPVERIVPPQTLQMDSPVAVVKTSRHYEDATRIVNYLFSDAGQRIWAEQGYRPTNPQIAAEFADQFPAPETIWTVADLGGWDQVGPRFFDAQNGFITGLFNQATQ